MTECFAARILLAIEELAAVRGGREYLTIVYAVATGRLATTALIGAGQQLGATMYQQLPPAESRGPTPVVGSRRRP